MKKAILYTLLASLMATGAVAFTPAKASATKCWLEGTTYDRCNGQPCPGGWCCQICTL